MARRDDCVFADGQSPQRSRRFGSGGGMIAHAMPLGCGAACATLPDRQSFLARIGINELL